MAAIDLNSDLGESFGVWKLGDDEAMLEVVTSANVACGFHAGDPSTLRAVCTAAVANGVVDRRPGRLSGPRRVRPPATSTSTRSSCATPCSTSSARSTRSPRSPAARSPTSSRTARCTTPRSHDPAQADAVVAAAAEYDPSLAVLGAPGSCLLRGRRDGRARAGRRGVRRPGLPPRRAAGAALGARCAGHRPGRGGRPRRAPGDGARGGVRRRHGRRGRGPLAVRPRRHAGRGRAGPRRARRARRCRRRASTRSRRDVIERHGCCVVRTPVGAWLRRAPTATAAEPPSACAARRAPLPRRRRRVAERRARRPADACRSSRRSHRAGALTPRAGGAARATLRDR